MGKNTRRRLQPTNATVMAAAMSIPSTAGALSASGCVSRRIQPRLRATVKATKIRTPHPSTVKSAKKQPMRRKKG